MKRSAFVALICIAVTAIAAGLATTGAPVRQPELPRTLNLLCAPHILWCEGDEDRISENLSQDNCRVRAPVLGRSAHPPAQRAG